MPKAAGLAAALKKAIPSVVVDKKPGGRGDFVVTVDGRLLWDKRGREGRFPEPDEILAKLAYPRG
ncbi:MAG: Rdx family protein [Planctomycetes bacterium]|nr:Rdx family protein [Planctomycetota bacterium]